MMTSFVRKAAILWALTVFLAAPGLTRAAKAPDIVETATGRSLSVSELADQVKGADVIFFGEFHDNAAIHELEAALFEALYERKGRNLALSLEMAEQDSQPVLDAYLKGKNRLCDYLVSTTKTEGRRCSNELAWSRVIWDITTVAWLLDERFMEDYLMPSPIPEYDGHYSVDPKRHLMRYVYHVNRDKVFSDLFTKLANFG